MAGTLADNPFAHLAGSFFTARTDPAVRAAPGGTTQYIWQAIQNDFGAAGQPLPPNAFQAVNEMQRWVTSVNRADDALGSALYRLNVDGRSTAIDSSMVADSLDARPLDARPEGAQYRVVYRTVYSVGGETFTDTFQHDFGYSLPETMDALQAQVDAAAALQVSDYGYDWEGVSVPISIRAY